MMIFERDIAIDLGTTNIRVFVRGKGIMLREPSIVAIDKYTGRMLKVGQDAQKMLGRTPANIVAIHPISAGVISDYDMTALMLKELLSRVTSFSLFKPRVLVCVPGSITGVEERAVVEDSVLLPGAHVKSGAHICRAILGENSTVEEGVKLGSVDTTKDTAVVGNDVVIGKGE